MKKPPQQLQIQDSYVQSAVRLPADLRSTIKDAAESNGRSMNAEIIARLQAAPITDRLDRIEREISEIKAMLREVLDR